MFHSLIAKIEGQTTVEKSVQALTSGFAAQLKAAGTDPVKLAELQTMLTENEAKISAAVVANTAPKPAASSAAAAPVPPTKTGA